MSRVGFSATNHPQQVEKRVPSDQDDDRRTPLTLFAALNAEFLFDLDAAANKDNALCPDFCSLPDDSGLVRSWEGRRVWCNPPYSDIRPWVEKAFDGSRVRHGNCPVSVLLLPANRTEQPFWQDLIEPYRDRGVGVSTRFIRGRRKFGYPEGHPVLSRGKGNAPPFGVVIVAFHGERK